MKETRELAFKCPVDGRVALLAETPDTVFSQEKIGCGVVIFPTNDAILAPTDGKVMMIFPTKHAIAIECANGIEYLIHVGINTIAMAGEGFSCCVLTAKKSDRAAAPTQSRLYLQIFQRNPCMS